MRKYTVAQVGIGQRGKIHANAFLELSDRFELTGLCDLDSEKLHAYAQEHDLSKDLLYHDAETMLSKTRPDVFCFVTQPNIRLPMVKLAVKYHVKGLACEKPMATSLEEASTMTRLCQENNIKAVVSHQQKYLTSFIKLKELIDAGEIGSITRIDVSCQAWLTQLGTHYMDYILWANGGSRARWVVGHVHGKELLSDSHPSPNYTMGVMEFENGVRSLIELGKLSPSYMPKENFWVDNRMTVHGTQGYVWCDTNGRWGACTRTSDGKIIGGEGPSWHIQQKERLQTLYLRDLADWFEQKTYKSYRG